MKFEVLAFDSNVAVDLLPDVQSLRDGQKLLADCTTHRVYVTAFQNFKEFNQHVHDIVWETEVWIAENPDQLIHYNGEKFLGPSTG